jgi:hypothetical protein
MRVRPLLTLAALFCTCLPGCTRVRYLTDISQVSTSTQSGTILPELQLYEQIIITRDRVTLTRKGMTPDTEVSEGTWEFAVDAQEVMAFWKQLEAIDCSSIREVKPDMPTVGGGTESYRIVYAGDRTFYLGYGQGTTYTNGMLIVEPIEAFIEGLDLPASATMQYKPSAD